MDDIILQTRKLLIYHELSDDLMISYYYSDLFEGHNVRFMEGKCAYLKKNVQIDNQKEFARRIINIFSYYFHHDRMKNVYAYISYAKMMKYYMRLHELVKVKDKVNNFKFIRQQYAQLEQYKNNVCKYYICIDLLLLIDKLYWCGIIDTRFLWFNEIDFDGFNGEVWDRLYLIKEHFGLNNK